MTYERKQQLLIRLQSLPEREQDIRNQLSDLNNIAANRYLYNEDPQFVGSLIQRDLQNIAAKNNLRFNSVRPVGTSKQLNGLNKISIQISFTGTNNQLLDFLSDIESHEPLLRTSRTSIRVQQTSTDYSDAVLVLNMNVSAFMEGDIRS
jgi:Tfp pilus assembly protein PilO